MATIVVGEGRRSSQFARKYPPLLTLVLAVLIALVILPSALNLPQANPSQTLEYAPIPPADDKPPPPNSSNLSSLGLASSSGVAGDTTGGGGPGPGDDPRLQQRTAATKHCIQNPDGTARETEDLQSPPCVSTYNGDNGGATYQGVTKSDITILLYADGSGDGASNTNGYPSNSQAGDATNPIGPLYQDTEAPASGTDNVVLRNARIMSRYFNDRFQTYNRHVHVWVYWSKKGTGVEGRRADAEDVTSGRVMPVPFAYLDQATFEGNNAVFTDAMSRRGVMNFGSYALGNQPNAFYNKFKPKVWGYFPDTEHKADEFVSYLCKNVVPFPVTDSGNFGQTGNGRPRKYGLMYTSDPRFPNLRQFTDLVRAGLKACGADLSPNEYTYPVAGLTIYAGQNPDYAVQNVAKMRADGVSTIIWTGGVETYTSKAAASTSYLPEWIIAGDSAIDGFFSTSNQDQTAFNHAWIVSNTERVDRTQDTPAYQAYRQVDPAYPAVDVDFPPMYLDFFQLFKAIQIAGPKLGPSSVDKGFHAIPPRASGTPYTPACYYDPGDFTCMKDATLEFWDSGGRPPTSQESTGCWRMVRGGQRFVAYQWPEGNDMSNKSAGTDHPCNGYDGGILVGAGAP